METAHFQLMSAADRDPTLEIARRLELIRAVLEREGLEANLEPRVPLVVCVFRDAESFARFRPRSGLEGFLVARPHRSFLVVHTGRGSDAGAAAVHEYVHFVLRNGEAVQYPPWYDEGLAEFLSSVSIESGRVVVGAVPTSRAGWLLYGNALSLRRLVTAQDPYEWSDPALRRFRAQSWATVHYFQVADRVGLPARHAQMLRYIALLNRGLEPDAASQQAFGATFEELESEFMLYLGRGQLPYLGFPLAELPVPDASRARPLGAYEQALLLGDLALALGDPWRQEAVRWLRRAARSRPGDGRAHAALASALERADPAAADAELALALGLGGGDPEVQRLVAESLLARAETADAAAARGLVERARAAFRRSIALDPEQVAAYAGLGRSFLVAPSFGDPEEGRAALERAHRRLPADRSILLGLARLESTSGRTARARALLTRIPPPSHGDPEVARERARLEEARRGVGLPPGPPRATRHLEAQLDVEVPEPGAQIRNLSGWVEVAGRGGLREATLHDVVIAIDASSSTLAPSGAEPSDPLATVLRAEVEAARALIRQLDPRTTRVAVLSFAGAARVLAALGPPDSALAALSARPLVADPSGTSPASALRRALAELFEHREVGVRRQRTILLLSDGQPTAPSVPRATRDALELADWLGGIGVPVQAFALGQTALENPDFYRSLAERSGGAFVPVENPAEVVSELANVRLTGLEDVSIRSSPGGGTGRAVRVLADGSFDAYVPLVEGENLVAVTASIEGGERLSATRRVFYERPTRPTPRDEAELERLRQALETRALELRLLAEIRGSSPRSRRLEIQVERPEAGAGAP